MPDKIDPTELNRPPHHQPYIHPSADITTVPGTGRAMSPTSNKTPPKPAQGPKRSIHARAPSKLSADSKASPQIKNGPITSASNSPTKRERCEVLGRDLVEDIIHILPRPRPKAIPSKPHAPSPDSRLGGR